MMPLVKEKMFGLWKESDSHMNFFAAADFPKRSIHEYLNRKIDHESDLKISNYLRNGHMLLGERSIVTSILDSNLRITGDCSVITDGT